MGSRCPRSAAVIAVAAFAMRLTGVRARRQSHRPAATDTVQTPSESADRANPSRPSVASTGVGDTPTTSTRTRYCTS